MGRYRLHDNALRMPSVPSAQALPHAYSPNNTLVPTPLARFQPGRDVGGDVPPADAKALAARHSGTVRRLGEEACLGMTLFDQMTNAIVFDVNFWHWRAIVEAIRSLGVLPKERVDDLHAQFVGELTAEEARIVAAAIRERLLPTLRGDERLLLDGRVTTEPDDGVMHHDPAEQHKNYSTDRRVLEEFAKCCESCGGFRVA